MTPDTSEQLLTPAPTDRRPAIWPWLVMPLITLLVYYGLHQQLRHERALEQLSPAESSRAPATDDP